MADGERERQVRRFVDQVWNGRNCEAADDLYSEKYANALGRVRQPESIPSAATTRRFPISTSMSRN